MQYVCEKCYKEFKLKTDLIRHKNKKYDCTDNNTCDKCNKYFKSKTDYTRHINRKFPCIKDDNESLTKPIDSQQSLVIINDEHICEDCNKSFTTKRSLDRHISQYCKNSGKLELYKTIDKMQQQIDALQKNTSNSLINNSNNETNLTNSLNNNLNNNTITNININAYGQEDLSHITDDDYKKIFTKFHSMVPMLLELIHFNEDKPENTNAYISNIKSKYAYIYDGKKWILKNKDELIDDIYDNKCIILIKKYGDIKNILNDRTVRNVDRFIDKHDENDVKRNASDRIELILYNNRNLAKK
jgi:uncharacterized C2H2 Zn-finger protein